MIVVGLIDRIRSAVTVFRNPLLLDQVHQQSTQHAAATIERLGRYAQNYQWYTGWKTRPSNNTVADPQSGRIRWNLFQPTVNFGAAYAVGPGITWKVANSEKASQAANDIWNRSDGDGEMMQAATCAALYGDMAVLIRRNDKGAYFDFLDVCCAEPTFSPADVTRLDAITLRGEDGNGKFLETWTGNERIVLRGEDEEREPFNETKGICPAVWIPNWCLKGQKFGFGDFDAAAPLMFEYEHMRIKLTKINDRYASPVIVALGTKKSDSELAKDIETVFYIPKSKADASVEYLEMRGAPPATMEHVNDIRNGICELTETPMIAYGKIDHGFANATGISLKVLLGPADNKSRRKRAIWIPRLAYAMKMGLLMDGFDVPVEDIEPMMRSPIPQSELELMTYLEGLTRIGASNREALRKAGYADGEVDQILSEREDEANAALDRELKVFDRGGQNAEN